MPALEMLSWERLEIEARTHPWRDGDGYAGACAAAAAGLAVRRLGVEGQRMRVFEEFALRGGLAGAEIVDAQQAIARMRLCKDAGEIELLRRAIAISEKALETTLAAARVGVDRARARIGPRPRALCRRRGSRFPFRRSWSPAPSPPRDTATPATTGSGPAIRFSSTTAPPIGGYNADVTRTVFVGEPSAEARALYETVREANRIGRAFARPGVTAGAVDDAVQSFLEKSPFVEGDLIKTGHGLGLDVHEAPQIMRGNDTVLEPGMVFTIEPGLYLAGPPRRAHRGRRGRDGHRDREPDHVPAGTAYRRLSRHAPVNAAARRNRAPAPARRLVAVSSRSMIRARLSPLRPSGGASPLRWS